MLSDRFSTKDGLPLTDMLKLMRTENVGAFMPWVLGLNITPFAVRNEHSQISSMLQSCSPTAATNPAMTMNLTERSRTVEDESPMKYWHFEPTRTMLNGC